VIDPHASEASKALYLVVVLSLAAIGLAAVSVVGVWQRLSRKKATRFVWGAALAPLVLGVAGLGLARGSQHMP
jgi:spore maturation protein SpmA